MAVSQLNSIKKVEAVADYLGIDLIFRGNKYPINVQSVEVEEYPIYGLLYWDTEDFNEFIEALQDIASLPYPNKIEYLKKRYPFETTLAQIDNVYVKDSYRESKLLLKDLITDVFEKSKTASGLYAEIDKRQMSHDFSTHSAFLYNGFYITPCNMRAAVKEVLDSINPLFVKMYVDHFYKCKVKQDLIIDDIINAWRNDDDYRLTVLDRMRHETNKIH